jgi:hypothetical protein
MKLKLGRKFGIYESPEIQCAVAPRTFSWIAGKLIPARSLAPEGLSTNCD